MSELNLWLSLTDYSTKHKVSVSTLRRRIKADDIKFKFEDGKYLLLDEHPGTHQRDYRPSQTSELTLMGALKKDIDFKESTLASLNQKKDEQLILSTNRLLTELKKAYSLVLQEKEEQILELKEEISDLKTLIKVLEGDNQRLREMNKQKSLDY